jgi:hypothetical protein
VKIWEKIRIFHFLSFQVIHVKDSTEDTFFHMYSCSADEIGRATSLLFLLYTRQSLVLTRSLQDIRVIFGILDTSDTSMSLISLH